MAVGRDMAKAVRAFNRFGLGARPGDLALAGNDPRGRLFEELRAPAVALIRERAPPSGAAALQAFYLDRQEKRLARMKAAEAASPMAQVAAATPVAGEAGAAISPALPMAPLASGTAPAPPHSPSPAQEMKPAKPPTVEQALFRAEAQARLSKQLAAEVGFVERLVAFWSNHFAVSAAKSGELRVAAGPFEREAIRPHALGKFAQLLRAAESHPAMILYLDNQSSIGPNAAPGKFAGRGLNENLAREILELHTLGVGSGYTQADVTELARILTGWSVAGPESEAGEPGSFLFKPNWHEPGARKLLGKTYAEAGVEQGRAALDDLARHPATARHIATKLARAFLADEPPPDLVAALAKTFRDSDGDLAEVASALVADDRAWNAEPTKIRTPLEFVLAAARATGFQPNDPGLYLQSLNLLGMPLWQPSGPNGFSDASEAWSSAEGLKARLDLSAFMGSRMRSDAEPLATLEAALGDTASPETVKAVERAESREQALALLFMAPEFQRR